ncbi:MAG: hypothetical protein WB643_13275 [Candidatus Bathyarchaeia archaeon]
MNKKEIRCHLEKWTQETLDRLSRNDEHGNEEHQLMATLVLAFSSQRLEKWTKVLVFLTIILAALTAVLLWRSL